MWPLNVTFSVTMRMITKCHTLYDCKRNMQPEQNSNSVFSIDHYWSNHTAYTTHDIHKSAHHGSTNNNNTNNNHMPQYNITRISTTTKTIVNHLTCYDFDCQKRVHRGQVDENSEMGFEKRRLCTQQTQYHNKCKMPLMRTPTASLSEFRDKGNFVWTNNPT